jgi:cell pole-organizing protein PopZ
MTTEPQDDVPMDRILACMRELITGEQAGSGNSRTTDLHSGKPMGDVFEVMDHMLNEANDVRATRQGAENHAAAIVSNSSREAIGRAFEIMDKASQQYSSFAGGLLEPVFSRAVQEAVTPNLQGWVNTHRAELLEAIKPLMREWMDAHLPGLVEAVLKEELGRAVAEHLRSRLG